MYIVLDTETTNGFDDPLVYDIGWAVFDENGTILLSRSFVVKEIFFNNSLMECAFFKDKIPQYLKDIEDKKRKVLSFLEIRSMLARDARSLGVRAIIAHNARFDYKACCTTVRYITTSKIRYFYPFGVKLYDSLKMAREVFGNDFDYSDFCYSHAYLTENNCPRMTAEVLYRFLKNDTMFDEDHTALEDVMIESVIFFECLKRGSKNLELFSKRYLEIFNGKSSYYVEARGAVFGAEYLTLEQIPLGAYILENDGTFKKSGTNIVF